MAEILKSYEFRQNGKYDWTKWLDGNIWKITAGTDYAVSDISFRCVVSNAAKTRGLAVRFSQVEDGIVIQAYTKKSSS